MSRNEYQDLDNSNVYSTGETQVGKWITGETIYRKVFEIPTTSISSQSTNVVSFSCPNVSPINIGGVIHVGTSNYDYSINGFRTQDYGVRHTTGGFDVIVGTSMSPEGTFSGYLVVDYIKNTN